MRSTYVFNFVIEVRSRRILALQKSDSGFIVRIFKILFQLCHPVLTLGELIYDKIKLEKSVQ